MPRLPAQVSTELWWLCCGCHEESASKTARLAPMTQVLPGHQHIDMAGAASEVEESSQSLVVLASVSRDLGAWSKYAQLNRCSTGPRVGLKLQTHHGHASLHHADCELAKSLGFTRIRPLVRDPEEENLTDCVDQTVLRAGLPKATALTPAPNRTQF